MTKFKAIKTLLFSAKLMINYPLMVRLPPIIPTVFLRRILILHQKKIYKKYIDTLHNLYTHTINMEHIIYKQESSGQPHIDQYRSKLYSLYTSTDRF